MKKYLCTVCGHVYDEDAGDEKNHIAKQTAFGDLPEKWTCPVCGAFRSQFRELQNPHTAETPKPKQEQPKIPDLTPLKHSIICSNLAKGCEKQFKPDSAAIFTSLAKEFKESLPKADAVSFAALQKDVEHDIASLIPTAKKVAENHHDRGALRALTWAEKVTRIQHSLLERHAAEGPALTKDKTIYLCPTCGFIFIDTHAPSKCPVCAVPDWKFEIVED